MENRLDNKESLIKGLKSTILFSSVHDEELAQIVDRAESVEYDQGDVLVREGESSDSLFLILNGIVAVKKQLSEGKDVLLAYLMNGNTVGEVGILENRPRSATVVAVSPVSVIKFSRDRFLDILVKHPNVSIELARILGKYLTAANKRVTRGDKETKVILVYNLFGLEDASLLSRMVAHRLQYVTSNETVLLEYPASDKSLKDLAPSEHSHTVKHPAGFDIYLGTNETIKKEANKLPVAIDKLLNNYTNVVVTVNKAIRENLTLVLENVDQVIFTGSENPAHWREIEATFRLLNTVKTSTDIDFFRLMFTEQRSVNGHQKIEEIDFLMSTSDSIPPFLSWTDEVIYADVENQQVLDKIIDRIERNNRIGIILPSTIDVNTPLDTKEYLEKTLSFMGKRFGGATSEEAHGVWKSQDVGLVDEKVFIVHSYVTSKDLKRFLDEVVEYVRNLKSELRQEAMALQVNSKLTLI